MKKNTATNKSENNTAAQTVRCVSRYNRISPRKVRIVIDSIRWKSVDQAFMILLGYKKKAARLAEKVLTSAVANAKGKGMEENRLYISDVRADGGLTMKRMMPRSMGRADRMLRRTTHLSVVLSEREKPFGGSNAAETPEDAAEKSKTGKSVKAKKASGKKKTAKAGAA